MGRPIRASGLSGIRRIVHPGAARSAAPLSGNPSAVRSGQTHTRNIPVRTRAARNVGMARLSATNQDASTTPGNPPNHGAWPG